MFIEEEYIIIVDNKEQLRGWIKYKINDEDK